jgi:hypothetical protein
MDGLVAATAAANGMAVATLNRMDFEKPGDGVGGVLEAYRWDVQMK